ncbi:Hydroxyacylglutathione hydrolase GloB [bacterium HR37]|nr:Hydroxyacylglutathione hydrolase GloB [bacterium HR37]
MDIIDYGTYSIGRIRIEGSDSNYNYIIWCNTTLHGAFVDPLNGSLLLDFTRAKKIKIRYIINTHAHPDHIGGNDEVLRKTEAVVLAHPEAKEFLGGSRLKTVNEGSVVQLGEQRIRIIHTPGHCPEHISIVLGNNVFVGDTLFLAGCGNTRYRGDISMLYKSIAFKLRPLPDDFRIFCGHEYSQKNLRFALSIEPDNEAAKKKLEEVLYMCSQGKDPFPTTIGEEKLYNPFFRFDVPEVVKKLKRRIPGLSDDPYEVFKELRKLRDEWV